MKSLAVGFAMIGALAAWLAVTPRTATAFDYSRPGRFYGGIETGVVVPLNAYNRYAGVGGSAAPFIGYKIFTDRDLQPNFGPVGQLQFFGTPAETCTQCPNSGHTDGAGDGPAYGFAYHVGPRITLPIGPVELFADWQVGGLSGANRPTAITGTKTAWGYTAGGGLGYSLNENIMLGLFGRWDWYNNNVHGVGKVHYATAGLSLTLQSVAAAAAAGSGRQGRGGATAGSASGQEEDRAARRQLRLRQVEHPSRCPARPRRGVQRRSKRSPRSTCRAMGIPTASARISTTWASRSAAPTPCATG